MAWVRLAAGVLGLRSQLIGRAQRVGGEMLDSELKIASFELVWLRAQMLHPTLLARNEARCTAPAHDHTVLRIVDKVVERHCCCLWNAGVDRNVRSEMPQEHESKQRTDADAGGKMVVVARSTEKHYAESKRSARDRHPGRASQKDNTLHTAQTDHSSFTSLAPASTWTCNIFSHCYNAFPPKSLCLSSGISILHTQKTRLNLHYHSITSAKRQAYILLYYVKHPGEGE